MRGSKGTKTRECSACGASADEPGVKACTICGKLLSEDYQPLDNIRSSYGLQRMALSAATPVNDAMQLFGTDEKNTPSQIAWASFVYSLVPYLGVLFIPVTLTISVFGYLKASKDPAVGGGQLAVRSFWLSFPVLVVQIVLWWLLYYIPELAA